MSLYLGQRVAYPVGDDFYSLGIMTSPNKVRLDSGSIREVPEPDKTLLRVGNTADQLKPIPYDQLKFASNWQLLLRSRDRCPVYGVNFLYGVWASVVNAARLNLPVPKIVITDRMEPGHLGSYWHPESRVGSISPGGMIEIARVKVFTYSGLVGTLIHEIAHQACWFKYKSIAHDKKWEEMVQHLSLAVGGVKVPRKVDETDSRLYKLPEPSNESKHPIYFLTVSTGGRYAATWSDSKAEIERIALHLDPDLDLKIYETRDPSLLDWIPPEEELKKFHQVNTQQLDRIKTGKRIY